MVRAALVSIALMALAGTASAASVNDCNGDDKVDVSDLNCWANKYQDRITKGDPLDCNGDGKVDVSDLLCRVNATVKEIFG